MRNVSILGPPRTGRVVKTEAQVKRELAEQAADRQGASHEDIAIIQTQGLAPKTTVGGNTNSEADLPIGDIFSYESLEQIDTKDFVLHGLETEEGRWEQLRLIGTLPNAFDLSFLQWVNLSNGEARLDFSEYVTSKGQIPHTRLAPMKMIYWFMRAGYEEHQKYQHESAKNQDTPAPGGAYALRSFLEHTKDEELDIHADHFQRIENKIWHTYHGWREHRFDSYLREIDIDWVSDRQELKEPQSGTKSPIRTLMSVLLGDSNLTRIQDVFQWIHSTVPRIETLVYTPGSIPHQNTTAGYSVGHWDQLIISATWRLETKGTAHLIIADEKDFTPRKVSP